MMLCQSYTRWFVWLVPRFHTVTTRTKFLQYGGPAEYKQEIRRWKNCSI